MPKRRGLEEFCREGEGVFMHLKALMYQAKKSQQISSSCTAVLGHSSVMWVGNHGAQLGRTELIARPYCSAEGENGRRYKIGQD